MIDPSQTPEPNRGSVYPPDQNGGSPTTIIEGSLPTQPSQTQPSDQPSPMPAMPASIAAMYDMSNSSLDESSRVRSLFSTMVKIDPAYVVERFTSSILAVDRADWGTRTPDSVSVWLSASLDLAPPTFWHTINTDKREKRPLIARLRNWMAHMIKIKNNAPVLNALRVLNRLPISDEDFAASKLIPVLKILRRTPGEIASAADTLGLKFKTYQQELESSLVSENSSGTVAAPAPKKAARTKLSEAEGPVDGKKLGVKQRALGSTHQPLSSISKRQSVRPVTTATPAPKEAAKPLGPVEARATLAIPDDSLGRNVLPKFTRPEKRHAAPVVATERAAPPPAKLQVDITAAKAVEEPDPTKTSVRIFSSIGDLKAQIGKRSRAQLTDREPETVEVEPKKARKVKTVRWKPDSELVSVRFIESVGDHHSLRSSKSAKDVDAAEGTATLSNRTMIEWYDPLEFEIDASRVLDARMLACMGTGRYGTREPKSAEAVLQKAREIKVAYAMFDPSNLPPSPSEPPPSHECEAAPVQMASFKPVPGPEPPASSTLVPNQQIPRAGTNMSGMMQPQNFMFPGMMPMYPGFMMPGMPLNMNQAPNQSNFGRK